MIEQAVANIERRYNDNGEVVQESIAFAQLPKKRLDIVFARYRVEVIPLFDKTPNVANLQKEIKDLRDALLASENLWDRGSDSIVNQCREALACSSEQL